MRTGCIDFLPLAAVPTLQAQSAKSQAASLLPGPKPPDTPAEWERFVGIYEYSNNGRYKHNVVILERNQRAYMHYSSGPDAEIHFDIHEGIGMMSVPDPVKESWSYEIIERPGTAASFVYLMESFVRRDVGADPAHFYHTIAAARSTSPSTTLPQVKPWKCQAFTMK